MPILKIIYSKILSSYKLMIKFHSFYSSLEALNITQGLNFYLEEQEMDGPFNSYMTLLIIRGQQSLYSNLALGEYVVVSRQLAGIMVEVLGN